MTVIEICSAYNQDQELLSQTTNEKTFDSNSLLIRECQTESIFGRTDIKEYIYKNGLIQKVNQYSHEDLQEIQAFFYDAFGRKTKEVHTNIDNQKLYESLINAQRTKETIKEYDLDGNISSTQVNIIDKDGKVLKEIEAGDYITEYKYHNGKVVNVKIHDAGELTLNEDYYFDQYGNEIGSKGFDFSTNEEVVIKREFNSFNKLVHERQFLNGEMDHEKFVTYDSQDRILKSEQISIDETFISEFQYLED